MAHKFMDRLKRSKAFNGVVYETPINDPAGVIIAKYDGDKSYNANNLPQGSASLEGAEFTVRYYDGFYDTEQQAEASGAPTRTWVFKTNKNLPQPSGTSTPIRPTPTTPPQRRTSTSRLVSGSVSRRTARPSRQTTSWARCLTTPTPSRSCAARRTRASSS